MKASESPWCRDYDPMYKLHDCELSAGHPGPHRALTGHEWSASQPIAAPGGPDSQADRTSRKEAP